MNDVKSLRAEVRARDAFLTKLTSTLSGCVEEVARAARARPPRGAELEEKILQLQAMLRELRVIADPHAPVPLRCRTVELGALLDRLFSERSQRLRQSGLMLSVERKGGVRCRVDAARFESMLDEVVSNALKYRRGRAVTVDMTVARASVIVCVTNHGSWIGPQPVFARFRRGDSRRSMTGFGIGLWLTRRLAEAHGGGVTVETTRACTRVIISLPCDAKRRAHASFRATLTPK